MAIPTIQSYRFGEMVVDGVTHRKDLLLLPGQVIPGWWRRQGHQLSVQDLDPILQAAPEALVVGCGASGMLQVLPDTRALLGRAGIELFVLPTNEAWRRYNELAPQRPTAGAFHLTC
jgi:hypothetical protein